MSPRHSRRRRSLRGRGLFGAVLILLGALVAADERGLPLNARQVPLADNLAVGDTVGKVRFLGMLTLPNLNVNGLRFAQLSDLAWDDTAGILYAVSDKGALFHLEPVFRDGQLVDARLRHAYPLRELKTNVPLKYKRTDSEGLDILPARKGQEAQLLVSFERYPRVVRYRPDGYAIQDEPLPAPLNDRAAYRDENRQLESVCYDPALGILTMPEAPLRAMPRGFNAIYSTSGKTWRYPVEGHNEVVALACLGGSDVLVLERDYGRLFWRAVVALKRVHLAPDGSPETPIAVETLVSLDSGQGFKIDNFEGLARHRGNRFFLVSDDNDLFIQRTLLLYLEIVDPRAP